MQWLSESLGVEERYITLAMGILCEAAAGTAYGFGIYSEALKNRLDYSQSELNSMSSIGNVGLYLAVVSGVVFDRYGPRVTGLIGVVLSLVGYLFMGLGAAGVIGGGHIHWGWMALFSALWQNGSSWGDMMAISTSTRNFPHDKGAVMGLLKSFFGLSASIISVLYQGFFLATATDPNKTASRFLYFLAAFSSGLLLLATLFHKIVPSMDQEPMGRGGKRRIALGLGAVAVAAAYIVAVTVLKNEDVVEASPGLAAPTIVLVLLVLVVAAPIPQLVDRPVTPRSGLGSEASAKLLMDALEEPAGSGVVVERAIEGKTVLEALLDSSFWLLFVGLLAGTGAGLTVINNVGQLVTALEPHDAGAASVYVVMISVGNAVGRMAFGALSDIFRAYVTRPGWLTIAVLCMALSQLLLAFSNPTLLYVACLAAGISYGAFWSLFPATLADVWGPKNFGTIYSLFSFAPAIGGYVFSAVLAADIYHANASPKHPKVCYGQDCYKETFLILAGVCAVGAAATALATYNLRFVYQRIAAIQREQNELRLRDSIQS